MRKINMQDGETLEYQPVTNAGGQCTSCMTMLIMYRERKSRGGSDNKSSKNWHILMVRSI